MISGLVKDGKTQPVVDYSECLFEKVYVETPVDTDGDGRLDLIAVYIRRPKETSQSCRVPAIYVANPYMMGCNEELYKSYDVDKNLTEYSKQNNSEENVLYDFSQTSTSLSEFLGRDTLKAEHKRETGGMAETAETEGITLDCITDWYSYFNSRGYATVFCGGLGTRGSEGMTVSGSREEILAFKAVIDWLNGRCRAFTNKTNNIEIRADWCTGNVAMTGKSYLGTLCIGVAATGVEGLKTIIPEAAISNWYAYDRVGGLNVPPLGWQGDDVALLSRYCCSRLMDEEDKQQIEKLYDDIINKMEKAQDRESGNYNKFWDERNYLRQADNIKASVFIVHGINDWNVKMNQCIPLWRELEKRDIPRRMVLHQGEHIYIYNLEGADFANQLHSWLDYWLYGIENDIEENAPVVLVQSNLDQYRWMHSEGFGKSSKALNKGVFPIHQSGVKTFCDDLSLTCYDREKDNAVQWRDELILSEKSEAYSVKYIGDVENNLRICGAVKLSFEATVNQGAAILSAMLVDYGDERRLITDNLEIAEKGGMSFGPSAPSEDVVRFAVEEEPSPYRIISRGWLNAQNRNNDWNKEAVEEGKFYRYSLEMIPTDYTVKAGHKLGLILYGTDVEATERPFTATEISVEQGSIQVEIPFIK